MTDETPLSERESLELITRMINKAKCEYRESGISALMWGSVVTFCSLASVAGYYFQWQWTRYVWFLTFIAVIPQVVISIRDSKKSKYKSYNEDAMGGIWISFGISIFILSYFTGTTKTDHAGTLFLILYGIPTFATGFTRKFAPMIIGGIACWASAVISLYASFPQVMLLTAISAQSAWFIPGLILRRRYIKAKEQHV